MKDVLLIGLGAEIGATLVAMNRPDTDGFRISTAVTNEISAGSQDPKVGPIQSVIARLLMAEPQLINDLSFDDSSNIIHVRGNPIEIIWGDIASVDPSTLQKHFTACVVATSKNHINDTVLMRGLTNISDYVVGVAEASNFPAVYPNLQNVSKRWLPNPHQPIGDNRIFALGSCQSNGWHAQLRAVLELAERQSFETFEVCSVEVDIVHPDTPTGRLGTKSIEPRSQDPRDNLRPSFSQIQQSMDLLFPDANKLNSVSLRTLVMPPGYQISRFFFRYRTAGTPRLNYETIRRSIGQTETEFPDILRATDLPLGSRAFQYCESSAVLLGGPEYLKFFDDPFTTHVGNQTPVSELITQAYVHNVRAYCRSIINTLRRFVHEETIDAFFR